MPFASLSSSSLFHGWSVSGSLEHQGKRSVPSGPVPLPLLRAAGYGSGCFAWSSHLLAVLLFRRPRYGRTPMLIRPREARARRGYGSAPDGAQPRFIVLLPSAAQPSPRSGSALSRHRRSGCGYRSAPPLAAAAQPASPRRVVLAAPMWIHRAPLRCSGAAAAACRHLTHRVRGGRSALPCRRTFRPRAVFPFALARRAQGGSSWTHQKKKGPTAASSCPSGTASSSSVIGPLSSSSRGCFRSKGLRSSSTPRSFEAADASPHRSGTTRWRSLRNALAGAVPQPGRTV
jgi:hypothetical protein